jgi:hypothetical protein
MRNGRSLDGLGAGGGGHRLAPHTRKAAAAAAEHLFPEHLFVMFFI